MTPDRKEPDAGLDDRELMVRAGNGDEEAFARIVRRHQKSLLNYFMRMGAHSEAAEDLSQETFVRLFTYRDRYKPIAGFTTFLYTLARHARADWLRKKARDPVPLHVDDGLEPAAPNPGPGEVEARLDVAFALTRLSQKLRETVVLTVLQGLTYPQAAEVLGLPLGTIKSRMFLAFDRLRGILLSDQETRDA